MAFFDGFSYLLYFVFCNNVYFKANSFKFYAKL